VSIYNGEIRIKIYLNISPME